MRHGPTLLWLFGVVAALGSGLACSAKGGSYVGRWECASGGSDFFEIKANEGAFLVTDESGKTYPASVDDKGTLVLSGVPLVGSLPLPIDSKSSELICSACSCNRYARKSDSGQADAKQRSVNDVEAQKQTIADIRNIGTAMFSWLTDQVGASAAGQSQVQPGSKVAGLARYSLISNERLTKILIPKYLKEIPTADGWGHPYEFYLNDKNVLAPQVMSIRSAGRDGKFSTSAYNVGSFPPNNFDEDIVWSDGFFVRWPQKQ
jgi:hypothetical protein